MDLTNPTRFPMNSFRSASAEFSAPSVHEDTDTGNPGDLYDSASWESAWIDLGGEG
jgi:hypothetical protein